MKFAKIFRNVKFGFRCDVCHRLWYVNDLTPATINMIQVLETEFQNEEIKDFKLCRTCYAACFKGNIPAMSRGNGYQYPSMPDFLPLDPISERLMAPRIAPMSIRRLRRMGGYGIRGQIINVPTDVDTMVRCLPRSLDDDYAFNVNIKRNLIHKSSYLSGYVKKSTIKMWLEFLEEKPLYKLAGIKIDWSVFDEETRTDCWY